MKLGKLLSPRPQACPYKTWRGKSFLQPFLTLMIPVLSSHGGSTTQGFFWPVVEKHICVDDIEIILALVYLMTAKCYVLSMSFFLYIKCWNNNKSLLSVFGFSFNGVQFLLATYERG